MSNAGRVKFDIPRVHARAREGARKGLIAAAEHVLGVANQRVPIDEGTLMRSGATQMTGDMSAAISYDTPYAVKVHEDRSARHDPGRQAKFLESAVNSEKGTVKNLIGEGLKSEL